MGTNRDRIDIIADILNVASNNAKKTHILYQANLSYKVLQRYLSEILEASLISYSEKDQFYMLTEKGKFLQSYKDYARTNKNAEKSISEIKSKKKKMEELCPSRTYPDVMTRQQL